MGRPEIEGVPTDGLHDSCEVDGEVKAKDKGWESVHNW